MRVFVAASGGVGGGGKGVGVCIIVGVRGLVWQLDGGLSRRIRRMRYGWGRMGCGIKIVRYKEGRAEDGGADDRELDGISLVCRRDEGGRLLLVDFAESESKFATDRHPFCGFEVGVLEDEDEGRGAEEGSILPVELRFAVFGRFM